MNTGVVIVAYNSAKDLPRCIASLRKAGIREIVVVDNASSDDSVRVAKDLDVIIIRSNQNKGFAAGANLGAGYIKSEYILFFNPDAVISSGAITEVENIFKADNNVGIVGLLLCDRAGRVETKSFGSLVTPLGLLTRKFAKQPILKPSVSVGWVSGGAMAVRRKLFAKLKGFDEGYFMYWEDMDICLQAKNSGFKVVLAANAKVTHMRGVSLTDKRKKAVFYDKSADRYFQKHYAWYIWLPLLLLRRIYRLLSPESF